MNQAHGDKLNRKSVKGARGYNQGRDLTRYKQSQVIELSRIIVLCFLVALFSIEPILVNVTQGGINKMEYAAPDLGMTRWRRVEK